MLIPLRPLIAILVLTPFFVAALKSAPRQTFEPREKWIEAARFIDTLFPSTSTIWMEELRHKNLRSYLGNPSRVKFARPLNNNFYQRGQEIVFDAHHHKTMPSIDPASLPRPTLWIPFVVRSGARKICWHDQPATIASATPRDGSVDEYEVIVPTPSRAVLVFFEGTPGITRVRALSSRQGEEVEIAPSQIVREGHVVAVPLPPSTTTLQFSAPDRLAVVRLFP